MPADSTQGAGSPRRSVPGWAWFVLVGVLTFGTFAPSIGSDFVDWDDNYNFLTNLAYRGLGAENLRWMFTSFHQGHFHPLSWVTAGLDYVLWGMDPHGYHLTNVVLHAVAAGLFAWVVSLLLREPGLRTSEDRPTTAAGVAIGCFTALAWSLHPLRVEPVSWVTQRREVLCGVFTLLALASHLRARPAWRTAVFSALAMLSKATAVTIPVLFVLIDVWRAGGIGAEAWLRSAARSAFRHAHLVLMAAATSILAVMAQRAAAAMIDTADLPITSRIALYFYGAFFYLLKTLAPVGLAPLHAGQVGVSWNLQPYVWWQAGAGFVLAVGALATGWRLRRRRPAWILFTAAYLVMLLPVGGLGQSGRQLVGERYAYQIGWVLTLAAALPVAALASARIVAPRLAVAGAAVFLVGLAVLSIRQQRCWTDSGALWTCELSAHPDDPIGNANLGAWYETRTPPDLEKAERYMRRSIESSPDYLTPHIKLAEVLQLARRPEDAVQVYSTLIEKNPQNAIALSKIAPLHWALGRKEAALAALARWVDAEPGNPDAFVQHAKALAAAGRGRDAVAVLERGIAATGSASVWSELAWLLATHPDPAIRNGKRALEAAERAASTKSRTTRTFVVLAAACAEAGEFDRGIREVTAAIPAVPPEHVPALLGVIGDLRAHSPVRIEPSYP